MVDSNRDYAQVIQEQRNGTETVSYTYGDDLISQHRQGVSSYYHYDGLGSTRALSDVAGIITDSYAYEAFGELLQQTGSTENSYLFTGEQFDQNLNQYYLRARYYNPNSGLFTQQDTYQGNTFDPVTLHKYLYANVDPLNMVDPSGKISIGSFMARIGIGAVLTTGSISGGISLMTRIAPPGANSSNWTPDIDGNITIWEASYWHRHGNGMAQSVPLSSVNLSRVSRSEFGRLGIVTPINLDTSHFFNPSDAAVYGSLKLVLTSNTTVAAFEGVDEFDFGSNPTGSFFRNLVTGFVGASLGDGQPFDIHLTGEATIGQ